ncbi:hypothetical protein AMJ52_05425 [candidate division TA06 bacterium DG_78]|uniref:Uncharacterized protein n=1 Tax=candidate division TA06 bacterium DG_78 TaxID=1703772 RepID=A0A0S7YDH9_UNCT6|nr:MAG: hypothetical protein AMJ52_05425 [candidate division TA06 bacterium DG_78]
MNDIKTLQQILKKDPRYPVEAYAFVLEALFYSRKKLNIRGHVTGQQLLEGIRDLARERYGMMAKMVFAHWGITKTIDFGNIVFNMVKEKMLGKTAEDSIEDFEDIYNFDEVFVKNYPLDLKRFKNVKT